MHMSMSNMIMRKAMTFFTFNLTTDRLMWVRRFPIQGLFRKPQKGDLKGENRMIWVLVGIFLGVTTERNVVRKSSHANPGSLSFHLHAVLSHRCFVSVNTDIIRKREREKEA